MLHIFSLQVNDVNKETFIKINHLNNTQYRSVVEFDKIQCFNPSRFFKFEATARIIVFFIIYLYDKLCSYFYRKEFDKINLM